MRHIVYKTINLINNKFYYGVYDTNRNLKNYLGSGVLLKKAIKKYGEDNFKRITLKSFDVEDDAYKYEREIITDLLIESDECYNLNIGGHGGKKSHSEETKKKLSKLAKKRVGAKNPFYGKKHTEKTKLKISNKKKKMSDETKRKMSLAAKKRYKLNGGIKGSTNYFGEDESETFKRTNTNIKIK